MVGGSVAQGAAVGTYKYLKYAAFNYASDTLNTVGGLAYSSPHTAIFTSLQTQSGLQSGATPSISILPPFTLFDLRSFYFGCVVPLENGAANEDTQCTVFVSGFKPGNQEAITATFTFTPPLVSVEKVPMQQAKLPDGFQQLTSATIVQADPTTQVLVIDDINYCVRKAY